MAFLFVAKVRDREREMKEKKAPVPSRYKTNYNVHEHELELDEQYREDARCSVCKQNFSEWFPYYSCRICSPGFFVHTSSCCDLPGALMGHFLHPNHTHPGHDLLLVWTGLQEFCSACGDHVRGGYFFKCTLCSFKLDVKCAMLTSTSLGETFRSPAHITDHHAFLPCRMSKDFSYSCCCCHLPIPYEIEDQGVSLLYACLDCKGLMHKSCAELVHQIEHPFHPSHPGSLQLCSIGDRCTVCREPTAVGYACMNCNFCIDVPCASLKKHTEENNQLAHNFTHPHPLTFVDNIEKYPIPCYGCGLPLGDSICYCPECKILLHKPCADFPPQVTDHPLHPEHALTLCDYQDGQSCRACLWSSCGFFYECSQCEFHLDVRCALLSKPTVVMSKLHIHPLVFLLNENKGTNAKCITCGEGLGNTNPIVRCVWCNLNQHLLCVSGLPPTVKYFRDDHPLTLTYSRITDWPDETDSAELYCDACEKRRDIRRPTYYCEECHYVSHIQCVVSEIVHFLEEEGSRHEEAGEQRVAVDEFLDSYTEEKASLANECDEEKPDASFTEGYDTTMEIRAELEVEKYKAGYKDGYKAGYKDGYLRALDNLKVPADSDLRQTIPGPPEPIVLEDETLPTGMVTDPPPTPAPTV